MTAAFVEDYTDLRDAGLTHTDIANRLGVRRESLIRRTFRNGCYIPERHEIPVIDALDRLIALGRPFRTFDAMPGYDGAAVMAAVVRARDTGRIVKVRDTRKGVVWRAAS